MDVSFWSSLHHKLVGLSMLLVAQAACRGLHSHVITLWCTIQDPDLIWIWTLDLNI